MGINLRHRNSLIHCSCWCSQLIICPRNFHRNIHYICTSLRFISWIICSRNPHIHSSYYCLITSCLNLNCYFIRNRSLVTRIKHIRINLGLIHSLCLNMGYSRHSCWNCFRMVTISWYIRRWYSHSCSHSTINSISLDNNRHRFILHISLGIISPLIC